MTEDSPTAGRRPTRVVILVFDGCDLLDSGGPYEVFLTASRLAQRRGESAPFDVEVVSIDGGRVTAYGGLGLVPTGGPELLGGARLIIVPGAIDLESALGQETLISTIKDWATGQDLVTASVCTGSFLLEAAGLLVDREWTTHWEDVDALAERTGGRGARRGVRWVDAGAVVTGGALSSGLAMSLHLVARFAGVELAEATARQLDYRWDNHSLVNSDRC